MQKSSIPSKKQLSKQAKHNATVSVAERGGPANVVKPGVPLDFRIKHFASPDAQVGMSKGATLNVGSYQSLRVDVWLTDGVHEGETVKDAYDRLDAIITKTLEEVVAEFDEE